MYIYVYDVVFKSNFVTLKRTYVDYSTCCSIFIVRATRYVKKKKWSCRSIY